MVGMTAFDHMSAAESSLQRTLEFFNRVDTKSSYVAALNTAMLALLALNFDYKFASNWLATDALLCTLMLAVSLYFVYRCQFPQLDGGHGSIVYFREITKRTESDFISEFHSATHEKYLDDILGQVWRNSEILQFKFAVLKRSFLLTGFALIPWFYYLAAVAYNSKALNIG
jgi:hypothetical protein